MKRASNVLAVALGLTATVLGCGTFVRETPLNPAPRPLTPQPPACVQVFTSTPPAEPHVDVALIDANTDVDRPPVASFVQSLRERGGQMGCDSIFIPTGQGLTSGWGGGAKRMQATCVVYNEPHPCRLFDPGGPGRRTCRDRQDFDAHRDCILPT